MRGLAPQGFLREADPRARADLPLKKESALTHGTAHATPSLENTITTKQQIYERGLHSAMGNGKPVLKQNNHHIMLLIGYVRV